MRTRPLRQNAAAIFSKSNRQRPQRLIEAIEPRVLLSTYTVTNLTTSGSGSLNAAVASALSAGGSSTINFQSNLAGTITESTPDSNAAATGTGPAAFVINNNASITINGADGGSGISLSGDSVMRLFYIASGASLELDDITLTGGLAQGGNGGLGNGDGGGGAGLGGAVFVNGGSLTIQRSTLDDNQAKGGSGAVEYGYGASGGGGGGMSGNGGNSVNDSGSIGGGYNGGASSSGSGGFGGGGGGGGVFGSTTTGGTGGFGGGGGGGTGNGDAGNGGAGGFGGGGGGGGTGYSFSPGGSGGAGGFGAGAGGFVFISSIIPAGGGGAGMGGAIFNDAGTVTLENSTLTSNTAQGGTGYSSGQGLGGAVFNYNGTLNATNVTISGNTATAADGIYNLGDGSTGTATAVINNTILGQSSTSVTDFVGNTINSGTSTTSGVGNLIRSETGFAGTVVSTSDPLLGSLTNNGGDTQTLLPGSTSPVIGAGVVSAIGGATTDQLGNARTVSGNVDIGSIEVANVVIAPVVTGSPSSATINSGGNTAFTSTATGTPTPTEQWQVSTNNGSTFTNISNGGVYSGATTATLTITGATASMNGDKYQDVFTNSNGTATTTAATLTVDVAPAVTTNPSSVTINTGSNTSFAAAATGNPTPTVQWQVSTDGGNTFSNLSNGGIYSGVTTGMLTLTNATSIQNGYEYQAVFSNTLSGASSASTAATTAATLTVDVAPAVTTNPSSATINTGSNTSFTAAATGNPTPTVQWQVSTNGGSTFSNISNGGIYSGATTGTLNLINATSTQNGYEYQAVFSNTLSGASSASTATTTAVTLTVDVAPAVTTNPSNATIYTGNNTSFTAAATGNPAPTVQWQVSTNGGSTFTHISNGGIYSGATTGTLTLTNATLADNGYEYHAVFSNTLSGASSASTATTTAATLTVDAQPVAHALSIAQQPGSATAGQALGTIVVDVLDQYGEILTSDQSTVQITAYDSTTSQVVAFSGTTSVNASSGVATFSNLLQDTAGSYLLSITDSDGLPVVTTNAVSVTPAAATQLAFVQQPANTTAGQTMAPIEVAVEDQYGNIVTSNVSGVVVQNFPNVLNGTVSASVINGIATFSDLYVTQAGTYTINASDYSLTAANSNSFTITPAAATQLVFVQQPSNTVAGQTMAPIQVAVEDQYGNIATSNVSGVVVQNFPNVLNGTVSASVINGIATFSDLYVTQAGTYTINASDYSLTAANSNSFTITPAAATQLVFVQQPSNTVAGQTMAPIEVAVEDQYGNIVTSNNSGVVVQNVPNVLNGTVSASVINGIATFNNIEVTQAGTYTINASDASLTAANSSSFTITPAAAAQLAFVRQPTNTVAGQTMAPIEVAVEDQYGNIVTSNNSGVVVQNVPNVLNGTISAGVSNGIATFSDLYVTRAGSYTINASDASLAAANSSSFTITPAAATQLAFVQQPANTVAGQTMAPIEVVVEDQYGNTVTSDISGVVVQSDPNVLNGTLSASVINGIAAFNDLYVTKAGTYSITASDASLSAANSSSFIVTPAAASQLVFVQQPTTAAVGKPIGELSVDVEDAFGNLEADDNSTVTLTAAGSGAELSGTTTVAAHAGVAVFSDVVIGSTGNHPLTATDGALSPVTTTAIITTSDYSVIAGANLATLTISTSTAFPTSPKPSQRLTAEVVSAATGKVVQLNTLGVKNGQATLAKLQFKTAGLYTLIVTDDYGHTMTKTMEVNAAAASKLAFASAPVMQNGHLIVTVQVKDRYGNITSAADGTLVTLKLASGPTRGHGPVLSGSLSATVSNGIATFPDVSVHHTGQGRLWANAPGLEDARSDIFTNA